MKMKSIVTAMALGLSSGLCIAHASQAFTVKVNNDTQCNQAKEHVNNNGKPILCAISYTVGGKIGICGYPTKSITPRGSSTLRYDCSKSKPPAKKYYINCTTHGKSFPSQFNKDNPLQDNEAQTQTFYVLSQTAAFKPPIVVQSTPIDPDTCEQPVSRAYYSRTDKKPLPQN